MTKGFNSMVYIAPIEILSNTSAADSQKRSNTYIWYYNLDILILKEQGKQRYVILSFCSTIIAMFTQHFIYCRGT